MFFLLLIVNFILAITLTKIILIYAEKIGIIDEPNKRSLHYVSKPRGGGVAILIIYLINLLMFWKFQLIINEGLLVALFISAVLVGCVGFYDDYKGASKGIRIFIHFLSAFLSIFIIQCGLDDAPFCFSGVEAWVYIGIIILSIVWLLNLFNFMDGIDGIAASEAIFFLLCFAFFSKNINMIDVSKISIILSTIIAGFLVWNWSPSKIFLGDVGSGFIGVTLGLLSYAGVKSGISPVIPVILLGVFIVDATFTLFIRICQKEKWYEAHCTHAYQNAAKKYNHKIVTIVICMINIFWLLPMSYLASEYEDISIYIAMIALSPVIIIVFKYNPGKNIS